MVPTLLEVQTLGLTREPCFALWIFQIAQGCRTGFEGGVALVPNFQVTSLSGPRNRRRLDNEGSERAAREMRTSRALDGSSTCIQLRAGRAECEA